MIGSTTVASAPSAISTVMRGVVSSACNSGRNRKARAAAATSHAMVARVASMMGVRETGRSFSAWSIWPAMARSSLAGRGGVSSACQDGCGSSIDSSGSAVFGLSALLLSVGAITGGALSPSPSLSAASMALRVSAIGSSFFWGLLAIAMVASFERRTVSAARLGLSCRAAPRARVPAEPAASVPGCRQFHPIGSAKRKKQVRSRVSHHR